MCCHGRRLAGCSHGDRLLVPGPTQSAINHLSPRPEGSRPTFNELLRGTTSQQLLARQLGREDVDRLDHRRLFQQLGRLGHQGGGHLATKVGLATGVVGEGVEDAELRWAETDREPGDGCWFLLHQGQASLQEAGYLSFLAGLGDQANKQPHRNYHRSPFDERAAFARQDRESGILLREEVLIDLPPPMGVGQPSSRTRYLQASLDRRPLTWLRHNVKERLPHRCG
jgi:hypothetical protein